MIGCLTKNDTTLAQVMILSYGEKSSPIRRWQKFGDKSRNM